MDSTAFKKWIIDNDIRRRTIEGFWECFESYKLEEPNEFNKYFQNFDKKLLILYNYQVVLKIKEWDEFIEEYDENIEYVEAYIKMIYKDEYIGYYSLLFNFSGEIFDGYFVIE